MNLDQLCKRLNEIAMVEVLEVVNNVIRIKSDITYKFVEDHELDDLIVMYNGNLRMTLRFQGYAIEESNGEVVVTRDCIFN